MRLPGWTVPILVVAVAAASLAGARLLAFPSLSVEFRAPTPGSPTTVAVFLVDGVRCVDTAQQAAGALKDTDGVLRFVAYASRNRVDVTFDPDVCSVEMVRDALEGPILDGASGSFMFGLFRVIEIDGRPVNS
jgi:hypothetical protein